MISGASRRPPVRASATSALSGPARSDRPCPHPGRVRGSSSTAGPSAGAEKVAPGVDHAVLEADLAHVDVRHASIAALVVQLPAAPPDPGGGLPEFLA